MKLNYLTWLRSRLATDSEEIVISAEIKTAEQLMRFLSTRGQAYQEIFTKTHVVFAERDGQILELLDSVNNDDEISFFSPIVGG